jgi:hypothetical protein
MTVYGPNSESAVENPNLRRLVLQDTGLSRALIIKAPLERLSCGGARFKDLDILRDPTHLMYLYVARSIFFDVASLRESQRLRWVRFDKCKELAATRTLLSLPALAELDIFDVRRITDYEVLTELTQLQRAWVKGNYVFDSSFQEMVGARGVWSFTPFKGNSPTASSANRARTYLGGADSNTFAPFELSESDEGRIEMHFSDWTEFESRLGQISDQRGSALLEGMLERVLVTEFPHEMDDGSVVFDSESQAIHIWLLDRATANRVGIALTRMWNSRSRFRALARDAARDSTNM